jgi:hypothetical protein
VRIWKPIVFTALLAGCAHASQYKTSPANREWSEAIEHAQQLAANARYASADSVLDDYAQTHPGSSGAREVPFWHGVFALEPANSEASVQAAREAFDAYLADSGTITHRAEAGALNRAARVIDSLSKARAADSIPSVHLTVADDSLRATARELDALKKVKALQDSLDKTTAELERIKKRLSTGKP